MKRMKNLSCLALAALLLLSLMISVSAADPEGKLAIHCEYEQTVIPSVPFSVYYVGSISGTSITTEGAFASMTLDAEGLDTDAWAGKALAAKGLVLTNHVSPNYSGKSNSSGELLFDHLTPGLYLVIGETATIDSYIYTSAPFFVAIPNRNPETGEFIYEQSVHAKFNREAVPVEKTVTRKVLKIWDDEGNEDKRPQEVTVRLFCDQQEYDKVVLNDQNNWRYTWEELPADHEWLVAEDPVIDYSTSIELEGVTFTVKNSNVKINPPDTPPTPPETPPEIPRTGLYWWPVLVLAAACLFFLTLGFLRRRTSGYGKKAR
ncbi:MAG: Cna B-type domain-containing protein [Oscillospiraceae bacterium]|nr:Cna B-type domain-containing protein [Oscillospiraceae bacterium]